MESEVFLFVHTQILAQPSQVVPENMDASVTLCVPEPSPSLYLFLQVSVHSLWAPSPFLTLLNLCTSSSRASQKMGNDLLTNFLLRTSLYRDDLVNG